MTLYEVGFCRIKKGYSNNKFTINPFPYSPSFPEGNVLRHFPYSILTLSPLNLTWNLLLQREIDRYQSKYSL